MDYTESNTEMVMLSMWSNPYIERTLPYKLRKTSNVKR